MSQQIAVHALGGRRRELTHPNAWQWSAGMAESMVTMESGSRGNEPLDPHNGADMISTQQGHSSLEDLSVGFSEDDSDVSPSAFRPTASHDGFHRQQESTSPFDLDSTSR